MIKNIENSLEIVPTLLRTLDEIGENLKLKIILLAFSILIFLPKAASAALIVQAPKYIGLNSGLALLEIRSAFSRSADAIGVLSLTGLVGFWNFNWQNCYNKNNYS